MFKKIIESDSVEGLELLLGENVLLLCMNYFYSGKLIGVNDDYVLLENPSIVYETGKWNEKGFADAQRLCSDKWYVRKQAIESFGVGK